MRFARLVVAALLFGASAVVSADEGAACSAASELECINSTACKLEQTTPHGPYVCRASRGRCEASFRQAGDDDIRKLCEATAGCEFKPGSCFCPPNVVCVCGGGPPAQCVERSKIAGGH